MARISPILTVTWSLYSWALPGVWILWWHSHLLIVVFDTSKPTSWRVLLICWTFTKGFFLNIWRIFLSSTTLVFLGLAGCLPLLSSSVCSCFFPIYQTVNFDTLNCLCLWYIYSYFSTYWWPAFLAFKLLGPHVERQTPNADGTTKIVGTINNNSYNFSPNMDVKTLKWKPKVSILKPHSDCFISTVFLLEYEAKTTKNVSLAYIEVLLFFRPNVRMGKKCDLSDFDRGMIVGIRQGGLNISEIE